MDYSALHADENPDHPAGSSPWGNSPVASPEHNRTSFASEPTDGPISPIPYNAAQSRSDYSSDHDTMAGDESTHNGSIGPNMSSDNGDSDRRPGTADSMPESSNQRYPQQQSQQPQVQHQQQQQQDSQKYHSGARAPQKQQYKLQGKITGLERTGRKDPILRFDVYVSIISLIIFCPLHIC